MFLRPAALLAVSALALVATGCGGNGSADPAPTPSASSSSLPATDSPTAEPAPESSSPTATESTSSGAPAIFDLLLPADRLPGFNEAWDWSEGATKTDPTRIGLCGRVPLETLGAEQSVTRSYVPTGDEVGGTGQHQVATFVDAKSVRQALAVLRTSHDNCARRVGNATTTVKVGQIQTVRTEKGTASWYLTTSIKKGADGGRFDALGVLSDGTTVELIDLDLDGAQDYNYPGGREPMVGALKNAATLLP